MEVQLLMGCRQMCNWLMEQRRIKSLLLVCIMLCNIKIMLLVSIMVLMLRQGLIICKTPNLNYCSNKIKMLYPKKNFTYKTL